jgi:hypothetical protein
MLPPFSGLKIEALAWRTVWCLVAKLSTNLLLRFSVPYMSVFIAFPAPCLFIHLFRVPDPSAHCADSSPPPQRPGWPKVPV